MRRLFRHAKKLMLLLPASAFCTLMVFADKSVAGMSDYSIAPPFTSQSAPPLVMLDVGRDHKLYYQAYNDAVDLDGDGRLDTDYTHYIDYYGYFDPYKCYTYDSGAGQFNPSSMNTDKFCGSGNWSGNVLNWLTMTRMDVLRKVLYGGKRLSPEKAAETVLERVFVPQDAHSWGKELTGRLCYNGSAGRYENSCSTVLDCRATTGYSCVDKSLNLIGFAAADSPTSCTAAAVTGVQTGKILVARYTHSSSKNCGVGNSQGMVNSYETQNYFRRDYVNDFNDASLDPNKNHYGDDYNILATAEFTVDISGDWQFAVDGDDDVEVQVDGIVVAQYLGCHGASGAQDHNGTINLSAGRHRLVARHFEKGGDEGVKVWYKKPGVSSWTIFGSGTLTISAPDIAAGNECSIKTTSFISTGIPSEGYVITGGTAKQHLFCNTTLSDGGTPIMRLLQNKSNRIWEWSAKERPVCNDPDHSSGYPFGSEWPTDYAVRVKVCDSAKGLETNCKTYGSSIKPTGLLQKYSDGDGTKVCSKAYSKSCSSSECGSGEGICIFRAPMYFGMISGSYRKNESGGVLRKNIGGMRDEIDTSNGTFNNTDGIIKNFNNLKLVGYRYSDYSYQASDGGTCGWITDRPLREGECRNWGNPIGEMLYESIRYFAGKGAATGEFTYDEADDAGLSLSKPNWGFVKDGTTYQPYDIYPSCSKPFILMLSDINPSYDSDQIPGSSFTKSDGTSFSEDSNMPQLGLGVQTDGVSLLNSLANTIGTHEAVANHSFFIGESNSLYDNLCTSKSVPNLSVIRGLCPEEPTKRGSYYSAALAYYGKTRMHDRTGRPDITTYAVALSSPVADLKIKTDGGLITFVPLGKSVSGCLGVYGACAQKCTLTSDDDGLHITGCATGSFCPTNQIVNFFVDDIRYNSSNEVIYARFRINFEDVEQGADHDMDAIAQYEICTQTATNLKYGSCVDTLGSNIQVKLSSDYAAGCIDQVLGFVISGTTADGTYLPIRDKDIVADSDTPDVVAGLPLTWSKTFTPSGTAAGFLKNPLWYAAKWGGFTDVNGNGIPDLVSEWAKNDGTNPDNYYLVVNPLKLEQQLDKALTDILAKTSSGTAASIVNNRGQSGANLITALFYPVKDFAENKKIEWIGDLQNYWYYFDPFINNSYMREDTVKDNFLDLVDDYRVDLVFDTDANKTVANKYRDNGKGAYTSTSTGDDPDTLNALWRAGELLYRRNLVSSPRKIYTTITGNSFLDGDFSLTNATALAPYLQTSDAAKVIRYVQGYDDPSDSTLRKRTVNYRGFTSPDPASGVGVWKLGDIIDSTPRIQSGKPLSGYHIDYGDKTYGSYIASNNYKNQGMVYVGAGDGMLHAFRLGRVVSRTNTTGTRKAELMNCASPAAELGSERWAFIPKDALPFLKYLSDPAYTHLYYVNDTSLLVDASINAPTGCGTGDYWDCEKKTTVSAAKDLTLSATSWRTVLIGGMGLGGASRPADGSCGSMTGSLPDCVKAPINEDPYRDVGLSSYFAMDVTDSESPSLMWRFSHPELGYSTVDPVIVRINGKKSGISYPTSNGRWFAVFASGPTGPIEPTSHQFYGKSDQNLRIFIVDLKTGTLVRKIDTGIKKAFAGSMAKNALDTDKGNKNSLGFHSTDVVYIGYVKPDAACSAWIDGGLLRLVTKDDLDPNNWELSTVIDGTGPVTASIEKMYDDRDSLSGSPELWLYFGTGRYFFRNSSAGIDSSDDRMAIYGIKEPCYSVSEIGGSWKKDNSKDINPACTRALTKGSLTDQSSDTPNDNLVTGKTGGWYINLDPSNAAYMAERCVTAPSAKTNGLLQYTTFKPTANICGFGGETMFWLVDYKTGGPPPCGSLTGKITIQLSTGAIVVVDLSKLTSDSFGRGGRQIGIGHGKSPATAPPSDSLKKPVKKVLHVKEK